MSLEISAPPSASLPGTARAQRFAWLAWTLLLGLALPLAALQVYLATVNHPNTLGDNLLMAIILLIFAVMGGLIASRRPENPRRP